MKINWKIRRENITFIAQIICSIVLPILTYFGMQWEDLTTWAALGSIFVDAIQNPVVVVAVILSVWHAVTDPTTPGLSDSELALSRKKLGDK